jgi:hypothetical protein
VAITSANPPLPLCTTNEAPLENAFKKINRSKKAAA